MVQSVRYGRNCSNDVTTWSSSRSYQSSHGRWVTLFVIVARRLPQYVPGKDCSVLRLGHIFDYDGRPVELV